MRKRKLRLAARAAFVVVSALATLLAEPLSAQESSPAAGAGTGAESQAPEAIDEVVVRGRRLGEIEDDLRLHIYDFLDEIAAPARSRGYARWYRRVCVGVHNLERSAAQYIIDRISSVVVEVGLEPGEPGCQPEINIIFTTDAKQLSAQMVELEPRAFRPIGGSAGMDRGRAALDAFVKSDRAVRWWHVSMPVNARTGGAGITLREMEIGPCAPNCYPQVNLPGPSRIKEGTRDDLQYVIVVVDGAKLKGTTWQQLADYLAVVSLAQIDLAADPAAFDSILNLFSNPAAYSGLTDWDRSYLLALYSVDTERVVRAQANQIVNRIAQRELDGTE